MCLCEGIGLDCKYALISDWYAHCANVVIIPLIALMSSYGPVSALANLGTTLQSTITSGGRVLDIIEETPETEKITGKSGVSFSGADCENVTFSYNQIFNA